MPTSGTCILTFSMLFIYGMCNGCVRYTFENDFGLLFTNEIGICGGMPFWQIGTYSSIPIERPHEDSYSFISPMPSLSCVSSFSFSMLAGGTVEVNIYMDGVSPNDQITLVVQQNATGAVAASTIYSALDPYFIRGWHILTVNLTGSGNFYGYVSNFKF